MLSHATRWCLAAKPWQQAILAHQKLTQQLRPGKNLVPQSVQERPELLVVLQLPVELPRNSICDAPIRGRSCLRRRLRCHFERWRRNVQRSAECCIACIDQLDSRRYESFKHFIGMSKRFSAHSSHNAHRRCATVSA